MSIELNIKDPAPGAAVPGMTVFFMDKKEQYFTGIKRDFDHEVEADRYFAQIMEENQRHGSFMISLLGENRNAFYTDYPGFVRITGQYTSIERIKEFHEEAWLYMEDKEWAKEQIRTLAVLANKNLEKCT